LTSSRTNCFINFGAILCEASIARATNKVSVVLAALIQTTPLAPTAVSNLTCSPKAAKTAELGCSRFLHVAREQLIV